MFYKSLVKLVNRVIKDEDIVITGGDWNCVQKRNLDTRGISFAYLPKPQYQKFIRRNNFVDIWRKQYPDKNSLHGDNYLSTYILV